MRTVFPRPGTAWDFTVTDLGVGIRPNVRDHLQCDLDADAAIVWAVQEHHTTKRGTIPGDLGLTLLKEFIDLNGGHMQIVSDAVYWWCKGNRTATALLAEPFPGTVVNVEINTADRRAYRLSSEPDDDGIF